MEKLKNWMHALDEDCKTDLFWVAFAAVIAAYLLLW